MLGSKDGVCIVASDYSRETCHACNGVGHGGGSCLCCLRGTRLGIGLETSLSSAHAVRDRVAGLRIVFAHPWTIARYAWEQVGFAPHGTSLATKHSTKSQLPLSSPDSLMLQEFPEIDRRPWLSFAVDLMDVFKFVRFLTHCKSRQCHGEI